MLATMEIPAILLMPGGWKQLRRALGLTQTEMAEIMCIGLRHIQKIEAGECLKPQRAHLMFLRAWLESPEGQHRLSLSRYPVEELKW